MEIGYPRPMKGIWKKIKDFDTAVVRNEITYFFKGTEFYEFNDELQRLNYEEPRDSGQFWMKCKYSVGEFSYQVSSSTECSVANLTLTVILSLILYFYKHS